MANNFYPVILAGGRGTRFWPLSRKELPKQYLALLDRRSLLETTVDRIAPLVPVERIHVVTTVAQGRLVAKYLPLVRHVYLEPAARNTAPCLMLALRELLRAGTPPDTTMIVLPADHHIADAPAFLELLRSGVALATASNGLVTLGIVPTYAHTGYGYIEMDRDRPAPGGQSFAVKRFVEKPDRARAEAFLADGSFLWNGGIFLWRLDALETALRRYVPGPWERLKNARSGEETAAVYRELPAEPIDTAVLEKADNIFVLPARMGWSDVGSWNALYELRRSREGETVTLGGSTREIDAHGCLVRAPDEKRVALVGVEDLIVVDTGDTLLIARRDHDQRLRELGDWLDR